MSKFYLVYSTFLDDESSKTLARFVVEAASKEAARKLAYDKLPHLIEYEQLDNICEDEIEVTIRDWEEWEKHLAGAWKEFYAFEPGD